MMMVVVLPFATLAVVAVLDEIFFGQDLSQVALGAIPVDRIDQISQLLLDDMDFALLSIDAVSDGLLRLVIEIVVLFLEVLHEDANEHAGWFVLLLCLLPSFIIIVFGMGIANVGIEC